MAAEANNDLELLNAFVDGELPPESRAMMAARLATEPELARIHATLARLKAEVGHYANGVEPGAVRFVRRPSRRLGLAAAGVAATLALVAAVLTFTELPTHRRSIAVPAESRVMSGPGNSVIPDLAAAGLMLKGVERDAAVPFERVIAVYTGPRGCRLELRIQPASAGAFPPTQATRLHRWRDGEIDYELAAFGMPLVRFAMIADAAERKTRLAGGEEQAQRRLREARHAAPPCTG